MFSLYFLWQILIAWAIHEKWRGWVLPAVLGGRVLRNSDR
jgi:hypothetical protein